MKNYIKWIILVNFCQHWFDHIPNPPYTLMSMLDIILLKQESELYHHLVTKGIRCVDYVWDWMCNGFKTVSCNYKLIC